MVVNKIETGIFERKDLKKLRVFFEDLDKNYDENRIKSFLSKKNNFAFVAKADGEILGFSYGYSLERPDKEYPMFYICSIFVAEDYQNKGIGTKLIDFIVKFANKNGHSSVFTMIDKKNIAATSLFNHFGIINRQNGKIIFSKEFNRR